jgi:hypothetical protein
MTLKASWADFALYNLPVRQGTGIADGCAVAAKCDLKAAGKGGILRVVIR